MYHSDASRPLLPQVGGAAADPGDLRLTAADGVSFMAHAARSARPNGAGMVILPDVRGLFTFYKELAVRFAEAGFESVALGPAAPRATSPWGVLAWAARPPGDSRPSCRGWPVRSGSTAKSRWSGW